MQSLSMSRMSDATSSSIKKVCWLLIRAIDEIAVARPSRFPELEKESVLCREELEATPPRGGVRDVPSTPSLTLGCFISSLVRKRRENMFSKISRR